jgi:ethanolamine utilization protein EutM
MSALGFIETKGRIGAIVALDTALKSSNVKLISLNRISGGLVSVILEGEVAAVMTALEAARKEAEKVTSKVTITLIPHPAEEIHKTIEELGKKAPFPKKRK